jgi:hypothetical protein
VWKSQPYEKPEQSCKLPPQQFYDEHINSLLPAADGFTLRLFFDPEDGDDMFIRNDGASTELLCITTEIPNLMFPSCGI